MNMFDFGDAVRRLKAGAKVARDSWNGKDMYLFLADALGPDSGAQFSVTVSAPEGLPIASVICMRTAQNTIQPGWLASHADILAEDWREVA